MPSSSTANIPTFGWAFPSSTPPVIACAAGAATASASVVPVVAIKTFALDI